MENKTSGQYEAVSVPLCKEVSQHNRASTGESVTCLRKIICYTDSYIYLVGLGAYISDSMRGSRKFCERGSNFDNVVFLFNEGREDPDTTISGPLSACQRNAMQMEFRWRADDDPKLNLAW